MQLTLSQAGNLESVNNYLKSLKNYPDILDSLPGTTLTIITELMAGYGAEIKYEYQMMRAETYLSTAVKDSGSTSIE